MIRKQQRCVGRQELTSTSDERCGMPPSTQQLVSVPIDMVGATADPRGWKTRKIRRCGHVWTLLFFGNVGASTWLMMVWISNKK